MTSLLSSAKRMILVPAGDSIATRITPGGLSTPFLNQQQIPLLNQVVGIEAAMRNILNNEKVPFDIRIGKFNDLFLKMGVHLDQLKKLVPQKIEVGTDPLPPPPLAAADAASGGEEAPFFSASGEEIASGNTDDETIEPRHTDDETIEPQPPFSFSNPKLAKLIDQLPPTNQQKGKQLLYAIQNNPFLKWDERGEMIFKGKLIRNASIYDLVNDFSRGSRTRKIATGGELLAQALRENGMDADFIANPKRRTMYLEKKKRLSFSTLSPIISQPYLGSPPQMTSTPRPPLNPSKMRLTPEEIKDLLFDDGEDRIYDRERDLVAEEEEEDDKDRAGTSTSTLQNIVEGSARRSQRLQERQDFSKPFVQATNLPRNISGKDTSRRGGGRGGKGGGKPQTGKGRSFKKSQSSSKVDGIRRCSKKNKKSSLSFKNFRWLAIC